MKQLWGQPAAVQHGAAVRRTLVLKNTKHHQIKIRPVTYFLYEFLIVKN